PALASSRAPAWARQEASPTTGEKAPEKAPEKPARREAPIEHWLTVGPFELPLPAFAPPKVGLRAAARAPEETHADVDHLDAEVGKVLAVPGAGAKAWEEEQVVTIPSGTGVRMAYGWFRLETPRFVKCELSIRSFQTLRVFVDGAEVASKKTVEDQGAAEPGAAKATLELEPGAHDVVVKTVFTPDGPEHWDLLG